MLYRDISLVSIFGLRGSLHVQRAEEAQGVSFQTEGPYEAKVVDGTCLMIYPEGEEPQFPQQLTSHTDVIFGRTHIGSVDVTATARFLTDCRVQAPASARGEAAVRVTAPPRTRFELRGCHGMRKGPRGWHLMRGKDRFNTR
jgi:hypothetical protein